MSKATLHPVLLSLLMFTIVANSPVLASQEESGHKASPGTALAREQAFLNPITEEDGNAGQEGLSSVMAKEQAFLKAIALIESTEGAYAPELSEQMLSLGLTLQAQRRHAEAVKVFKRGVHLARISNGLYSAEQIPLLRGEIQSHMSLGNYSEADERQHYLYKVEVRSLGSDGPRADALMQQANWQYSAYRLGLGWQGFGRLTNMWDLFRLALHDIIKREGETSVKLLRPLDGMLLTQYLIASFDGEVGDGGLNFSSNYSSQQDANRFYSYRAQSYKAGQSVIRAIYDVQRRQHGSDSVEAARALVMLGDWAQWHEKRNEAERVYNDALAELAEPDDAQAEGVQLFAEPVALPDVEGIRPLPPAVSPEQGNILLEFGVNMRGRVTDLVRLDDNPDTQASANRLMRELRKTRFRPRYEAGQAVETVKLVRAYNIQE